MSDPNFIVRARDALGNETLQGALKKVRSGFVDKRLAAIHNEPDFERMRDQAKEVRERSLRDLDIYIQHFESQVQAAGGQVHWAETPEELNRIVISICRNAGVKTVTKGKSMVAEECYLNAALEAAGITPWETDLGEYIIQLAHELPSHIVAPAMHKTRQQIETLFRDAHSLGERDLSLISAIVNEARAVLRQRFLNADAGITGANMLIAESGSIVLVTNEGNGDLTACLPRTHIVTTSFDRVVPTWEDAAKIIRVLARSTTGQEISSYTSFFSGPKGPGNLDGPENFHVVLLDNRRTELFASQYREMLHCIRCGACLNHCPVYQSVGGHAYDSVYPGPMGSVLSPLLRGYSQDFELPNASTFCGRCEEVCPVRIPLPHLMRELRNQEREQHAPPLSTRFVFSMFNLLAGKPAIYRIMTSIVIRVLNRLGRRRGRFSWLPLVAGWTGFRDLPAPQGDTFQSQWRRAKSRSDVDHVDQGSKHG